MRAISVFLTLTFSTAACRDDSASGIGGDGGRPPIERDGGGGVVDDGGVAPPRDGGEPADAALPIAADQARVAQGLLQGEITDGIRRFLGIPFAAPPVRERRFQPPAPPEVWTALRDATSFGDVCLQRERNGDELIGSEDCLTLNVWAPEDASGLPVMVWIHGGGFVQGSAQLPLYDGQTLAASGDVVVVSIQYRVGPLGFLAAPSLVAEAEGRAGQAASVGNWGILDQIAALDWIQDNAAAFGGDPAQVTVFGESAGGSSICVHLGSPLSSGLFRAAVIQSGGGCLSYPDTATAEDHARGIVAETSCAGSSDELTCLRSAPAEELVEAQFRVGSTGLGLPPLGPVVDGIVLSDVPIALIESGLGNDVPTITGSNADEAVLFTIATPVPTRNAFESALATVVGPGLAASVAALYPPSEFPRPKQAYNAAFSDLTFICPTLEFARAARGGAPAYAYHFTHALSGPRANLGAIHGAEIPFVFDNLEALEGYSPTAEDEIVVSAMQTAWLRLGRGEAPDDAWPAFADGTSDVRIFQTGGAVTSETIRGGRCEELAALGVFELR